VPTAAEPSNCVTAAASAERPPPFIARARGLHPQPPSNEAPAHKTATTPIRSTVDGFGISAQKA